MYICTYEYLQWAAKVLVLLYILTQKSLYRLNTLALRRDNDFKRVFGRSFERTDKPQIKDYTRHVSSIPNRLSGVLDFKRYSTKYKG